MNPSVPQAAIQSLATFRDPAGSLTLGHDAAYRRVHPHAQAETLAFLDDELVGSLVEQGRLVASEILERDSAPGELRLRHPLIEPASYCWEWPPSLWLAAAEL